MKTEFKDVAHLYLGAEVVNTIGKHMGKIVSASIDGTATINPLDEFKPRVIMLNSLKPILRPLSDMDEETAKRGHWSSKNHFFEFIKLHQYGQEKHNRYFANDLLFLCKEGFDLFGLIESGEALDKTKLQ